IKKDGIYEWP
ncbi:hypothetical protein A2U01_0072148, partial [Trifolium medium]|nr:hypothetical protein [Trifolium medium]